MSKYPREEGTFFGMPREYFSWWILGGFLLLCLSFSLGVYYGYGQGYSDARNAFKNQNQEANTERMADSQSGNEESSESEESNRFESVITQRDLGETRTADETSPTPGPSGQETRETGRETASVGSSRETETVPDDGEENYAAPDQINPESVDEPQGPTPSSVDPESQASESSQPVQQTPSNDTGQSEESQANRIPSDSQPQFTIQVLSSTNQERTKQRHQDLLDQGYEAMLTTETINGKVWYRVRLGKFATKPRAEQFAESLQKKGIISNYWIGRLSS